MTLKPGDRVMLNEEAWKVFRIANGRRYGRRIGVLVRIDRWYDRLTARVRWPDRPSLAFCELDRLMPADDKLYIPPGSTEPLYDPRELVTRQAKKRHLTFAIRRLNHKCYPPLWPEDC